VGSQRGGEEGKGMKGHEKEDGDGKDTSLLRTDGRYRLAGCVKRLTHQTLFLFVNNANF